MNLREEESNESEKDWLINIRNNKINLKKIIIILYN